MIKKPLTKQQTIRVSSTISRAKAPTSVTNSVFNNLRTKQRRSTPMLQTLNGLYKQTQAGQQQTELSGFSGLNQKLTSTTTIGLTDGTNFKMPTYTMQGGQYLPNPALKTMTPGAVYNGGLGAGTPMPGKTISLEQASSLIQTNTRVNKYHGGSSGSLSASERTEMATMLQRMVMEGYARGVDIPAMIKKLPGGQIKIGLANWSGNGIGIGGAGGALFRRDWWHSKNANQKMSLFFQEASHGLGNMSDSARGKLNLSTNDWRGFMDGVKNVAPGTATYNQYADWLMEGLKKFSKVYTTTTPTGPIDYSNSMGTNADGSNPYNDFINGLGQGLAMGPDGQPMIGAPAPIIQAPPPPQITPPAPIPTTFAGGGMPMTNITPDGGRGATIGLDTNPFQGAAGGGNNALDASISNSMDSFQDPLSNIPAATGPMLQGLAGALL